MIPFFDAAAVRAAVSPERAFAAVREAFVAYARGEWSMPPKVYVAGLSGGGLSRDAGARGGARDPQVGHVVSGQPGAGAADGDGARAVSDAATGMLRGVLDAGAVTALRTARPRCSQRRRSGGRRRDGGGDRRRRQRARRGRGASSRGDGTPLVWDVDAARAEAAAGSSAGARSSGRGARGGLARDGHAGKELVLAAGSLRPGQHVSLMGADGPGKAEIALDGAAAACGCSATTGSSRATAASSRARSRQAGSRGSA